MSQISDYAAAAAATTTAAAAAAAAATARWREQLWKARKDLATAQARLACAQQEQGLYEYGDLGGDRHIFSASRRNVQVWSEQRREWICCQMQMQLRI